MNQIFFAAEKEHKESVESATVVCSAETSSDPHIDYQCSIEQADEHMESESDSYSNISDSGDWELEGAPRETRVTDFADITSTIDMFSKPSPVMLDSFFKFHPKLPAVSLPFQSKAKNRKIKDFTKGRPPDPTVEAHW